MQAGQDKIYYVVGDSLAAARSHPAIEALRARKVEVLLLGRRIDAWVMDHLQEFEGKNFKDATRGDLELGQPRERRRQGKGRGAAQGEQDRCSSASRMRSATGSREVRVSTRLKDSAAVLVAGEHDISAPLRRALEAAGQKAPAGKPVLELNVDHHLVKYLEKRADAERVRRPRAGALRTGDAGRRSAACPIPAPSCSGSIELLGAARLEPASQRIVCNNAAPNKPESRDARSHWPVATIALGRTAHGRLPSRDKPADPSAARG